MKVVKNLFSPKIDCNNYKALAFSKEKSKYRLLVINYGIFFDSFIPIFIYNYEAYIFIIN